MTRKPTLGLMVTLLMFPQIVETLYSPALGSIADGFSVSYQSAGQTLSVYFLAFALGVVVFGVLADRLGRRPAMLIGLGLYGIATYGATQTSSFPMLLALRALSAFGISVGSIVTQTMLRDCFSGIELGRVFSVMGIGLGISPVLGMFLGGKLTELGGYIYVFSALSISAVLLLIHSTVKLPETKTDASPLALSSVFARLVKDPFVWLSAVLVAGYNIALFAYYQQGIGLFMRLGYGVAEFGHSGLLLGISTLGGSALNRMLLSEGKGISQTALLSLAASMLVVGALGVWIIRDSIWFLAPMALVVMAFGIAIPNIVSSALVEYRHCAGSAGAIFGLSYYLMIGTGLMFSAQLNSLGMTLLGVSVVIGAATCARSIVTPESRLRSS